MITHLFPYDQTESKLDEKKLTWLHNGDDWFEYYHRTTMGVDTTIHIQTMVLHTPAETLSSNQSEDPNPCNTTFHLPSMTEF